MSFRNRVAAGQRLASTLRHLRDENVVVLGLPRGGVPVAAEVARALRAPLDVLVVRKVGVPWRPELAMGAIGEGDAGVVNDAVVRMAGVKPDELGAAQARARAEVQRRVQAFRDHRPRVPLAGRTAVIVDDGVATGSTARAACRIARAQGATRIVLAVPVASADAVAGLSDAADNVVCLLTPASFGAVGQFYDDFTPTTEAQVIALLDQAAAPHDATAAPARQPRRPVNDDVVIAAGGAELAGRLTLPDGATGMVVFVHGSGSSRHSPRNEYVAEVLHGARLGTLVFDLLTGDEETQRGNVFDIELLAGRLVQVIAWLDAQPATRVVPVGLFGASTGAAAALWAATEPGVEVAAVVSRGGRPDLAGARLAQVRAPTLLVVGSLDDLVLSLNRDAAARLRCPHRLAVVPGATHLFEEPGTLQSAAVLAADWFTDHLTAAGPPASGPNGPGRGRRSGEG
jgi:putative phosphoribosyl transferase